MHIVTSCQDDWHNAIGSRMTLGHWTTRLLNQLEQGTLPRLDISLRIAPLVAGLFYGCSWRETIGGEVDYNRSVSRKSKVHKPASGPEHCNNIINWHCMLTLLHFQ